MKRSLTRNGLLSAVLLATAAPVVAAPVKNAQSLTQVAQAMPNDRHEQRREAPGPHQVGKPDPRRGGDHMLHHARMGPVVLGLDIAAKLSAAETYVGVTADQEDAWRAYTSALIDFFDRPMPREDDREAGPRPDRGSAPSAQRERPELSRAGPLFVEHLADRAIEQGEKAKALKEAAEALRSALSDQQFGRLAEAERAFMPGPGRHAPDRGPDERPGAHHERGERTEGPRTPSPTPPPADN